MSRQITFEEFVKRSKEIHGGYYDYGISRKAWKGYGKEVLITCPVHGEFIQKASNHAIGRGCTKCSTEYRAGKMRMTREEFIKKATLKHNGKYTYNEVLYDGAKKKVIITCPLHGAFSQKPGQHLFGNGCPKCAANYSEKKAEETAKKKNDLILSAPTWSVPRGRK